jgi:ribonuclease VapC
LTVVLDASAVLAWILDEPGGDAVAAAMPGGVMTAVNAAEVAERLHRDFDEDAVRASLALMLPPTIAADLELALAAGLLTATTRAAGLSLGDRFCLALAQRLGCPALTADRAWLKIADAVGVEVRLIR